MTTLPPRRTPYFVAGGTLGPHIPSYVKRPSDDELFEHVMMGELCYVLTPRQMGKSSLVARTIVRLKNEDIAAANIDLQDSGGLDEDTFYLNILDELRRAFALDIAVEDWWDENGRLGASLRFRRFFTDHLLPQVTSRVVIFIDEIDTMLTMPFRDNFFAAIRALFNGRASNIELERLTFVLLGVASPSDLIKDPDRTPFNIGTKININEFGSKDAQPLLKGLEKEHPQQAQAILDRIFHWTSGHPYLTQQLCLRITQQSDYDWHDAAIDALVRQTFLSDEARNEDNIKLIQSRIDGSSHKRRLLQLYRQVYDGKIIKEDKASIAQNQLLLSGLISLTGGQLQVRNHIYRNVFNQNWIRRETDINWVLWFFVSSLLILAFAFSIVIFNLIIQPSRQRDFENEYLFAESVPTESAALGKLACLQPFIFGESNDFDRRVTTLFFERESWEAQKSIYDFRHFHEHPQGLVCIIQDIYGSLVDDDFSNSTTPMLQIMLDNLRQVEHPDTEVLIQELELWISGREYLQQENFDQALEAYSAAIAINPNNPSILFERARIYTIRANNLSATNPSISLDQYNLALADLDRVASFILLQPEAPETQATSTATILPTTTLNSTAITPSTSTNPPSPPTLSSPTISANSQAEIVSTNEPTTTAVPISTVIENPTVTVLPTQTPLPLSTPGPLLPKLNTRGQWISLVLTFLEKETAVKNILFNQEGTYTNLRNLGVAENIENIQLTVRILDPENNPIENAQVLIFHEGPPASQFSDSNGIAVFDTNENQLNARIVVRHDEHDIREQEISLSESDSVNIQLNPNDESEGQIIIYLVANENGRPQSGATITIISEGNIFQDTTDNSGLARFQLDFSTGQLNAELNVSTEEYVTTSRSFTFLPYDVINIRLNSETESIEIPNPLTVPTSFISDEFNAPSSFISDIEQINETEPNDTRETAQSLSSIGPENPVLGTIRATENDGNAGDIDWYEFTAVAGQTYVIEIFNVANNIDLVSRRYNCSGSTQTLTGMRIIVNDPVGNEVSRVCTPNGRANVHTFISFVAGVSGSHTFQVTAHAPQVSGDYNLRILPKFDDELAKWDGTTLEPNNTLSNAFAIIPGYENGLTSVIEPRQAQYSTSNGDVDIYRFTAVAGLTYVVELYNVANNLSLETGRYNCEGSTRDYAGLRLIIYDPVQNEVTRKCTPNGVGNVHSILAFTAGSTGDHFLHVAAHESTVSGNYSIRVLPKYDEPNASWDETTFEPNNRAENAYMLTVNGNPLQSRIEGVSNVYSTNRSDVDWYRFEVIAEVTYIVEIIDIDISIAENSYRYNCEGSTQTYAGFYLAVLDDSVTEISRQCTPNGAGDVHTAIEFTATRSGTYYSITYPHNIDADGDYSIRIRRTNP